MHRLFLHTGVEKQLARFPRPFAERLTQAIRSLAANPHPTQVKSLGQDLYRLRVSNYRIVYAVFDDKQEIVVCKVARRSEKTYRDLVALLAMARQTAARQEPTPAPAKPMPAKKKAKRKKR
jgi:mRNA interferase RelE/StbE